VLELEAHGFPPLAAKASQELAYLADITLACGFLQSEKAGEYPIRLRASLDPQ